MYLTLSPPHFGQVHSFTKGGYLGGGWSAGFAFCLKGFHIAAPLSSVAQCSDGTLDIADGSDQLTSRQVEIDVLVCSLRFSVHERVRTAEQCASLLCQFNGRIDIRLRVLLATVQHSCAS